MESAVIGEQLSWKHALAVTGVILVISYAVLQFLNTRGNSLPQNSWIAVGVLLLMTALMLYVGNDIRVYLKGESRRPPSPQKARSTLVAAQACVLGGAAFAGWYAGTAAVQVARLGTTTGPGAFAVAAVLTLACVALVVSGLVVQSWCKLPDDDDDISKPGKRGRGDGRAGEVI